MIEIEPPTDDLRALFASERDVSAVERVAIKQKLAASLAAPAPATAAIATTKLAWIAAAAIATAAGIWWWTHRAHDPVAAPAPAPTPASEIVPAEPKITTTAPESPAPVAMPEVAPPAERTPSQAELLAQAWKELPTNPMRALELVQLDARAHANGALAEEREALHVQVLAALDRKDEATDLAKRFLEHYPKSVHRKRVEAVLK